MRTRLYVVGILGGIGLLAVTLVAVLAFGRHNPSPPPLAENPKPEIPGEILYQDREQCFVVAQASGAGEERLGCAIKQGSFGQELYWTEDNAVRWLHQTSPTQGNVIEIDIRTGELRDTGRTATVPNPPIVPLPRLPTLRNVHGCLQAPDGVFACINDDGGLVIVNGDLIAEVATFDLPQFNVPNVRAWSPDSQWVVLQYQPQRGSRGPEIWIVKRDGSVRGTLAKDTGYGGIAWRIEGVGTYPAPPY